MRSPFRRGSDTTSRERRTTVGERTTLGESSGGRRGSNLAERLTSGNRRGSDSPMTPRGGTDAPPAPPAGRHMLQRQDSKVSMAL